MFIDSHVKLSTEDISHLFYPKSLAIVGISRRENSLGKNLFDNLLASGYNGSIYPVNPKMDEFEGYPVFHKLSDIQGEVELVVSLVSRKYVLSLVEDCISKNVKALVIITSGFGEIDEEGKIIEDRILALTNKNKIRVIGPNSMGVRSELMDLSFSPVRGKVGDIGFISQSGAIGAVTMNHTNQKGVGLSKFISIGNKRDLDENNLLEYLATDDSTKVVMMYLESIKDGNLLRELFNSNPLSKPVIVVKSGRTSEGSRAAKSHTGAVSGRDDLISTMFHDLNIIRVRGIKEMVDVAYTFKKSLLPSGDRIGIISNAGGPGTLTTDEVIQRGLRVPLLTGDLQRELREVLPDEASTQNPVDVLPSASPETYRHCIEVLQNSDEVNIVIVLLLPPVLYPIQDMLNTINLIKKTKPVIVVAMGCEGTISNYVSYSFPIFYTPEEAAIAVEALSRFTLNQKKLTTRKSSFSGGIPNHMIEIVERILVQNKGIVKQADISEIFSQYNIPEVPSQVASNVDEITKIADLFGYPVVLKAQSENILHKSDKDAVKLNIQNEIELVEAFSELIQIYRSLNIDSNEVIIQKQINTYFELGVGGIRDPNLGSFVLVAHGGKYIEINNDSLLHSAPLTVSEALEMIRSLKIYPRIRGYRGDRGMDETTIAEILVNLSLLISNHKNIKEIDLNPIIGFDKNLYCVDSRIILFDSMEL